MRDIQTVRQAGTVFVIMGVSGTGKTTIARAMSQQISGVFLEGDDFHSEENIRIMSSGQPLTDDNRWPWLKALASAAAENSQNSNVIMTCSALKRSYRDEIRSVVPDALFIHLQGSIDYIGNLMANRKDHFMPVSLLQSQFDTLENLEIDEGGITISIENGVDDVLTKFGAFMSGGAN